MVEIAANTLIRNKRLVQVLCLLLLIMVVTAMSCGTPVVPITLRNRTSESLTIFVNDNELGNVAPGREIKNTYVPY